MAIQLKTKEEIEKIKEGGYILARVLDKLVQMVKVGISTGEIDAVAEEEILKVGGVPSFKGYHPVGFLKAFPKTICASINNEIVHGIPSFDRILKDGDIIGIDIGMKYKNHFTDMAKTVCVGNVSKEAKELVRVTEDALKLAILQVKPNNTVQDIGRAIQNYVDKFGYGIVRGLVGHGVGNAIWEEPQIPNYITNKASRIKLKPGMVIAIEPMLNIGSYEYQTLNDDWTITTVDGSLSAHFEHTIIVTETGHQIATL